MATLGEIRTRGEVTDIRQVMNYLRQLEDQVRYALANLDEENIRAGAIGETQLSRDVNKTIRAAAETAARSTEATARNEKNVNRLQGQAVRKTEDSQPFLMHFGPEPPQGHGVVWIAPGEITDGTADCAVKYVE